MKFGNKNRWMPCGALTLAMLGGILSCGASPQGSSQGNAQLDSTRQVSLLFKSLTYDERLNDKRKSLRVGVLWNVDDSSSSKVGNKILTAMGEVAGMRVRGLPISVHPVGVNLQTTAVAEIEKQRVSVLYFSPSLGPMKEGLCQYAANKKLIVISGNQHYASDCAAVTVVKRGGSPKILLNKKNASLQGASFSKTLEESPGAEIVE